VIDSADALSEPEFQPDYDPVHRFSAWLERAGKAEATVEAYHADVADLVRAFVPRPLNELRSQDLSDYLQARASFEGWSVPTVRRHLQAIKSFYRYLVTEEEIRAPGPAELLAEPVPEPRAPHIIEPSEVAAIFSYLEARSASDPAAAMDLALYGIAYHGALLISEAIGLTLDAVRGGASVIKLDVIGRRREESQITLEGDAAAWMSAWLAVRPAPTRTTDKPFVFIHPRTKLHTSRQRAWDRLKRLAKAAGLDEDVAERITPHTLRHSYASHLAARALDVAALRAALRQRSPRHASKYIPRADHDAGAGA